MAEVKLPGNSFKEQQRIANGLPEPQQFGPESSPAAGPGASYQPKRVATARVVPSTPKDEDLSFGKRFKKAMIDTDPGVAAKDLFWHSILPVAKKNAVDFVNSFLQQTFGISAPILSSSASRPSSGATVYQSSRFGPSASVQRPAITTTTVIPTTARSNVVSKGKYDFSCIRFDLRAEAEDVYYEMVDAIQTGGYVTVASFLISCGCDTQPQDRYWGWYDWHGVRFVRMDDGSFALIPPEPVEIGK